MTDVRVRFAPSPTGPLHIGGVRTALFNYLFAKKHGGTFYLRVEDTDQNRYVEGAEKYILDSLDWLGIAPSETVGRNEKFGPYRQSERKKMYREYADKLVESGNAYYAFDSTESLDFHRTDHEEKGKTFIYNHHNRLKLDNSLSISADDLKKKLDAGDNYVIRFKTPTDEILHLKDMIRGEIEIDTNLLDDKILFKSDGMPTYHLANVVDDHLMETSHVIRGEEWLPSMALHYLLYRSFGWEIPQFAHLPLILKPVGNGKLSKRDGEKLGFPVFPIGWQTENGMQKGYRESGFFPEAVINFLALLGWNDGTEKELFSLEELVDSFDIERVHKAGAKFDPDKNKWFNHQYLQLQEDSDLAKAFQEILKEKNIHESDEKVVEVVKLVKERADYPADLWNLSNYFFASPTDFNAKDLKVWKPETEEILSKLKNEIAQQEDFSSGSLETNLKAWMTENNIGMGKVMQPLRLAMVGEMSGASVFDIIAFVGKDETIRRIDFALAKIPTML